MAFGHPKVIATVPPGTVKYIDFNGQTTPGVKQTIINKTVPTGKFWTLYYLPIICRMEGNFNILYDATIIGSGRTGAATPNTYYSWPLGRPILSSSIIKVEFTSRSGSSIVDLEGFLHYTERNSI